MYSERPECADNIGHQVTGCLEKLGPYFYFAFVDSDLRSMFIIQYSIRLCIAKYCGLVNKLQDTGCISDTFLLK